MVIEHQNYDLIYNRISNKERLKLNKGKIEILFTNWVVLGIEFIKTMECITILENSQSRIKS